MEKRVKFTSPKTISFLYLFLLMYTIAALVWWGVLLHKQNKEIVVLKMDKLSLEYPEDIYPATFEDRYNTILRDSQMHDVQIFGEGIAFLLIILISAGFVYDATRRQMNFSQQQRNWMLAVTHELKSPIAILKLNIETLLRRKFPEDKQRYLMGKMLVEANRLDRLTRNILLSSRFENRQYKLMKEKVDLSDLVEKVYKQNKGRIKGGEIVSAIEPGISVQGDFLMLNIVCNNLIENAEKYAPEGSRIVISLSKSGKEAHLLIKDNGEGIEDEEKEKIFDRFYRVGNENTRRSKGTGLGLFLTKKIVNEHGGEVTVRDNEPTGSIFEITLPTL